jgi:aryl-alcohol dehydrogenase
MRASCDSVQITAAVVRAKGGPFHIEQLMLEAPRRDEVLVRMVACGMCHTDLVARDQRFDVPHPIVLRHEGAGIVERVGSDVRSVSEGFSAAQSREHDAAGVRPA